MKNQDKIKYLADVVTRLPENEREQYLKSQTNDETLINQVNTLVSKNSHKKTNQTLVANDFKVGDIIGPYQILKEIGHGGMGTVFLVQQKQPIKRKLALKLIRLGMDTHEVLARFDQEKQALGLMSHPNVAAVYDAGATDSGRPYFVMEYVNGQSITNYADQNRLTINQRIYLVKQVCKGILHAHQKGILHRDIKPGNILVTERDGIPLVKIIDFGVAKSTQQENNNKAFLTRVNSFIGTPYYMSPEQAGVSSWVVDTRTDVYSTGVLLYELMTGSLPFDQYTFQDKSPYEIQQIIKDHVTLTPYEKLNSASYIQQNIAQLRQTTVHDIKKNLKGDLSSIIMHAIEKDPENRYQSVSALNADLTRLIKNQPVTAQPPTKTYRIKKFLSRHKLLVASVFSIVTALLVGLIIALNALNHAERESVHAEAVSSLISDILLNAVPSNLNYRDQITLKEVVIELEKKMDSGSFLSDAKFDRAKSLGLENSLQWTLREHLADVHKSVGNFEAANKNYQQAIELRNTYDSNQLVPLVTLNLKRSKTLVSLGQLELAEQLFNESVALIDPPQNKDQAKVLLEADGVFRSKSEISKSIKFERYLLNIAEQFFGVNSNEYSWQMVELASNLIQTSDSKLIEEGLKLVNDARDIAQQLPSPDLSIELNARRFIIYILNSTDINQALIESKDFLKWSEDKFGPEHLNTIDAGSLLAYVLLWSGQYQEALMITEKLMPILEKSVEPDHYLYRSLNKYRGNALVLLNRFEEAIPVLEQELAIAQKQESNPEIAYISVSIAQTAYYLGDLNKARLSIDNAIAKESNMNNMSTMHAEKAQIELASGHQSEAIEQAKRAIEINDNNVLAYSVLGHANLKSGNQKSAIEYFRQAELSHRNYAGSDGENYLVVLSDLVLALLLTDNKDQAYELSEQLNIDEVNNAMAAYTKLIYLTAKTSVLSKSGHINTQEEANNLYQIIASTWASSTVQTQSAKQAIQIINSITNE